MKSPSIAQRGEGGVRGGSGELDPTAQGKPVTERDACDDSSLARRGETRLAGRLNCVNANPHVKIPPMEYFAFLIDFILHVDKHLEAFTRNYGMWVYALLFLIVFVETGVVVMPFLPGDSLLFVVGALCGIGLLSLPLAMGVLVTAAILGDQCNYSIGRYFGPKVFQWEQSRFFNKRAFNQAHEFYERYGGITIILARFMPFLRTFAPFVAGVAEMSRTKFSAYNVLGALIWVVGVSSAGYFFGNLPWVQANLSKIIWAMILIPGLVVLYGAWKASRAKANAV